MEGATKEFLETLSKDLSFIKEYIVSQSVPKASLKNTWVTADVAKELLNVKETKFKSIRNAGEVTWRYRNGNRGVEVLLKSIEEYKSKTSTSPNLKVA